MKDFMWGIFRGIIHFKLRDTIEPILYRVVFQLKQKMCFFRIIQMPLMFRDLILVMFGRPLVGFSEGIIQLFFGCTIYQFYYRG